MYVVLSLSIVTFQTRNNLRSTMLVLLILYAASGAAEQVSTTTPTPMSYGTPRPQNITCSGVYGTSHNTNELLENLVARVFDNADSETKAIIKRKFIDYLAKSPVFLDTIGCNSTGRVPRQDDEDGDDDGGGGGGGGAAGALAGGANPLDNSNVLNGVRRILANVFTGNLVGVIQESVGLRSPEPVATVFTDVLSTLFGSTATAGITGIIGNLTTTASPLLNASSTLPPGYEAYIQQHYLQQQYLQQQALLQQQQQQQQLGSGSQNGVVPGGLQGGVNAQKFQQQYGTNTFSQQSVRRPGVSGTYNQNPAVINTQQQTQTSAFGNVYQQQQLSNVGASQLKPKPTRNRVTQPPINEDEYDDDD